MQPLSDASQPPKIVVLISGSGSNLQNLINNINKGHIDAEISLVISNKANVMGLALAQQANIPTQTILHGDFETKKQFEANLQHAIEDVQPNLIVLAGFMRVLSAQFTHRFAGKIMNIHPSLLPHYKGIHTHQRVLEAGDKTHGATVHFASEVLDGGPIIIQATVAVHADDDAPTLASRVLQQEHIIYPIAIKWFCEGRLRMGDGHVTLDNQTLPLEGVCLST